MKTVTMFRILAATVLAATCPTVTGTQDVLVIAHRGGSMLGNENTLSCIRTGMEKLLSTAVPAKRLVEKYGYAPSLLENLHALGKAVKIWTVNSVETCRSCPWTGDNH